MCGNVFGADAGFRGTEFNWAAAFGGAIGTLVSYVPVIIIVGAMGNLAEQRSIQAQNEELRAEQLTKHLTALQQELKTAVESRNNAT